MQATSVKKHLLQNHCPLCDSDRLKSFYKDKKRSYIRCCHCELVFVPESFWLSQEEEKATYDLHENDPLDEAYRRFLSRLSEPLLQKLRGKQHGLDFGCGPGPALSLLLQAGGMQVDLYDRFYFNDRSLLEKNYDFICATEVLEHLHQPGSEFERLVSMLKTGGWLGIMTKLVINEQAFKNWHYIRDMTHICFYSRSTFEYLARRFNMQVEFIANDVILLKKSE
jgi:hypothetical protein